MICGEMPRVSPLKNGERDASYIHQLSRGVVDLSSRERPDSPRLLLSGYAQQAPASGQLCRNCAAASP